ncbi:hypothetical protein Barb4_00389 [Bacteroidales bacterium Barb4]|nr:hypothetical protein Barb4_00389 [Bacteroidales bacterium Barb4]
MCPNAKRSWGTEAGHNLDQQKPQKRAQQQLINQCYAEIPKGWDISAPHAVNMNNTFSNHGQSYIFCRPCRTISSNNSSIF